MLLITMILNGFLSTAVRNELKILNDGVCYG